jgi:hypothetical protein
MIEPTYNSPARYVAAMGEPGRPMGEPGRIA